MNEELKRLEQFGLLEISEIKPTGIKCKLSHNCIKGILNSIRGVRIGHHSLNEKRKKKVVLDGVKGMIQQIGFCNGNCPSCNFFACEIIFEIWKQMERAGQVNLKTGVIVKHHILLTLSIVEEEVKKSFKKNSFVASAIFTPDKIYYVPSYENDIEKEEMYKGLRKLIQNENPERYWFVSEAWLGYNIFTAPSEDENREKKVIIIEYSRSDPTKEKTVLYNLDFDNHALVNREEHTGNEYNDRMNFYLEDTVEERGQQYFKEKLTEWIREHEKSVVEDAKEFLGSNDTEYVIKNMVEAALNDGIFPPGFIDKYKGKQEEEKEGDKNN